MGIVAAGAEVEATIITEATTITMQTVTAADSTTVIPIANLRLGAPTFKSAKACSLTTCSSVGTPKDKLAPSQATSTTSLFPSKAITTTYHAAAPRTSERAKAEAASRPLTSLKLS